MTQTDEKGRVLRQTELIAKDLDKIYEPIIDKIVSAAIRGDMEAVNRYAANGKKELSRYVLEQRHEDFFNGERVGVVAGRKEAGAMFLSAFEAELRQEAKSYAGRMADPKFKDALKAAKRAVAAITQTTEVPDEQ